MAERERVAMTVREVARLAACSERTVWRAIRDEQLPSHKVGRTVSRRVWDDDAREWAEGVLSGQATPIRRRIDP